MTRMQASLIKTDKKILKKTSENQRLKIRYIRVQKKEWLADDTDTGIADQDG